jgi:hypothetical protein
MLSKSDTPVDRVKSELSILGIEAAFLAPTQVSLNNSIIDAHSDFRRFLTENKIHDFDAQAKGSSNKKILPISLIEKDCIKKSSISLYRPETRGGDPRLWISGLKKYAQPSNLLAVFAKNGELYVVNVSNKEIYDTRLLQDAPFGSLLLGSSPKLESPDSDSALSTSTQFGNQENKFLAELLNLQQDGSESISAPSNWAKTEPLLKVETKLDSVIENLLDRVRTSEQVPDSVFWHFFVGSPGNGKSAAAGSLARKLIKAGYLICDESDNALEDIQPSQIPYLLKVYKEGNNFSSLWIAQDASVVRNPYGIEADPSKELIELIKDAANKKVSLVVCTNRGVLERASRIGAHDREDQQSSWFLSIKSATEGKQGAIIPLPDKKRNEGKVVVSSTNLEIQSLLFRSDIANNLITVATSRGDWEICKSCAASEMCPYANNRKWLSTESGRDTVISLLKYVELLSGQLIVFREFLALLSLILAGSPTDYGDETPCQWVHRELASRNFFKLASRRVYMILFSSYAPSGLEYSKGVRSEQIRHIKQILDETPTLPSSIRGAVQNVILKNGDDFVSNDVGVQRLLARDGIFSKLDVINAPLPSQFLGKWSIGSNEIESLSDGLSSELERSIINIFSKLSDCIESSSILSGKHYFWLSRWYTSFFFRIGALAERRFSLGDEIARLAVILDVKREESNELLLLRSIARIEKTLNDLLLGDGSGVRVSEYGRLKGKWVTEQLRPRLSTVESLGVLGIPVEFGPKERELLNAEAFAWLLRKVDTNMTMTSFPMQHLESVEDALVRAAALSDYSVAQSDIELEIGLPNAKTISLIRFRGSVSVE